ncbi:MAG: hypothetical protein ACRDVE_07560 [Actinocrinis sp.]
MRSMTRGGGRRPAPRWLAAFVALVAGLALVGAAGPASAGTAPISKAAAPSGPVSSDGTSIGGAQPNLVTPFTGSGCHTYNYWNGAEVCITVNGPSLNMQSATGYTDGPDSDEGHLYDTEGVISIYGHPVNHHLTISWASGGGVWLANGDNMCFSDTTLGQTACLTMRL